MNPNDKSTAKRNEKRNEDASKTIEEPIAEVSDQHAEAVAGGFAEYEEVAQPFIRAC